MTADRNEQLRTSDLAGRNRETDPSPQTTTRPGSAADRSVGRGADDAGRAEHDEQPLLPGVELEGFRERWETIQTGFVDEPREAVSEADGLVAEVMQQLADTFARERNQLEGQWDRGEDVSTEDLRVSLQRYRSFFNRLLRT